MDKWNISATQFILYDKLSENFVIHFKYLHETINSNIFVLQEHEEKVKKITTNFYIAQNGNITMLYLHVSDLNNHPV